MAEMYDYLVFFYWLSGITTILAAILLFEVLRLKNYMRSFSRNIETSVSEIHIIKKRMDELYKKDSQRIEKSDVKNISERMMSPYIFEKK